jgi:hypothetical protein
MFLDVTVTRDDQPSTAGDLGYPLGVLDGRTLYRALRPLSLEDDCARIPGVRHIGAHGSKHAGEAKEVSVYVVPDLGGLYPAHAAARWEFS